MINFYSFVKIKKEIKKIVTLATSHHLIKLHKFDVIISQSLLKETEGKKGKTESMKGTNSTA